MNAHIRRRARSACICAALAGLLGACSTGLPLMPAQFRGTEAKGSPDFKAPARPALPAMTTREDLALLEEGAEGPYRMGPGDVLRIDVFGRPEVSGRHVVGPDGRITVPLVGELALGELTRDEGTQVLANRLRQFYSQPLATLGIEDYASNQVTVLGRVERAGSQRFARTPTLAEVLAGAGALPISDKQATLTRGAIMRGRDKLIWVDLKSMLNGDLAYNIRMRKGDIVYIPDAAETAVYVLGAVNKPGSFRLAPRMTLLDALAQAGGASEDAAPKRIGLYRAGARSVEIIDLAGVIDPSRLRNYALEDGDTIYVPTSGMADIGYALRQLGPAVSVLTFGLTVKGATK
jgi:polysaccharide export outer membrane protein